MPDVIPGSDISVANGPAISASTSPISIASGDRLIINNGISISSGDDDAVVADFLDLDVEIAGSVMGDFGGLFLSSTDTSNAVNYSVDVAATGIAAGDDAQGIFAGGSEASGLVAGNTVTINNAGLIRSNGFDAVRVPFTDIATLVNTGVISSFDQTNFFASAVTFGVVNIANVTNSGTISNTTPVDGPSDFWDEIAALSFRTVGQVTFNNSGTVTANTIALYSDAVVSENIINSGTLDGDVVLSDIVGGTFENTATGVINGTLRAYGGDDVIENNGTHNGSVTLGDGDDIYTGTATINGQINGGGGDDTIFGSGGDDSMVGRSGNDEMRGREGNDFLNGDAGDDDLSGGGGDDEIRGGSGNDTLSGASGNDVLSGGGGNDYVGGGAGDDFIQGASGADELVGGDGNDFVGGGGNNDVLYGRDGEDTLRGSDGNDLLIGGADADLLVGGSGNDTFQWLDVTDSGTTTPTADVIRDFGDGADRLDISDLAAEAFVFRGSDSFTGTGAAEVRVSVSSGGDSFVRLDVDGDGDWDMQFIVEETNDLTASDFIL